MGRQGYHNWKGFAKIWFEERNMKQIEKGEKEAWHMCEQQEREGKQRPEYRFVEREEEIRIKKWNKRS